MRTDNLIQHVESLYKVDANILCSIPSTDAQEASEGVAVLDVRCRGFEHVSREHKKFKGLLAPLPARKTNASAGYDFVSLETITLLPGQIYNFVTDVKAYMPEDEVLMINVRSSIGFKKHCCLVNTLGWIDSDFYGNPDNDGNISICLMNYGNTTVTIEREERIAQGMFINYKTKDNDELDRKGERTGGIGSTGTK